MYIQETALPTIYVWCMAMPRRGSKTHKRSKQAIVLSVVLAEEIAQESHKKLCQKLYMIHCRPADKLSNEFEKLAVRRYIMLTMMATPPANCSEIA